MHWQAESEIQVYQEWQQLHSFAGQAVHPGRAAARPAAYTLPKADKSDSLQGRSGQT